MLHKFTGLIFGLFLLTACNSSAQGGVHPTLTPPIIPTTAQPAPTPTIISRGGFINYNQLRVTMSQAEITHSYVTEFGSTREPSTPETKFLWVEVLLENIDVKEHTLPSPEHFSVIFGKSEFKASYGYRAGHPDYLNLKPEVYQSQTLKAWLRFEIPDSAELKDLWFAFMPESFQFNALPRTENYSWAQHPVYLWRCEY